MSRMSQRFRIEGLRLTPRDIHCLMDCYQNGVLSYAQIAKRHFPGRAKQTVSNRLSRLVSGGFLTRKKLGMYLLPETLEPVDVIFQVTRQTLYWLKRIYPEDVFRDEPVRIQGHTLSHDLLLTDVLTKLQGKFPHQEVINSKTKKVNPREQERIPDAVILDANGKAETAIELELTAKSEARYREIILSYQVHPEIKKVLYVYSEPSIRTKMTRIILGRQNVTHVTKNETQPFEFISLGELFRETTALKRTPQYQKERENLQWE